MKFEREREGEREKGREYSVLCVWREEWGASAESILKFELTVNNGRERGNGIATHASVFFLPAERW